MKELKSHYDVIIAGAGPVGLSLALALARRDKQVLLLEKERTLSVHSRAPAIWPRTQEVLASLGVIDEFLNNGIIHPEVELWDADNDESLIYLPLKELKTLTPYPQLLLLPQAKTEELLLRKLREYTNVDIRFSAPLQNFLQDKDKTDISVTFMEDQHLQFATGSFLVGCDGAHSSVRKILNLHLKGKTYSVKAALADVRIEETMPLKSPRISTDEVLAVGIKISSELWRIILPYSESDNMDLDLRISKAAQNLFDVRQAPVVWKSEFKLHQRLSPRLVKGRVALAGDAAHLNSPVGGQGMNAGIQDTEVLTEYLCRALKTNDSNMLNAYDRKREKTIEEGVNQFTDRLTKTLLVGHGTAIKPILKLTGKALRVPYIRSRLLQKIAMLT